MSSLLVAGLTPLATGTLTGSDDYMRFVRLFAWLDGASWHAILEPRLNAPHGAEVPWTRAIDIPLAAVQSLVERFLDRPAAAMATATLVPAMQVLALLTLASWLRRPLLRKPQALLGALIALLLPTLIVSVLPGRVDHHTWQLLLIAIVLGALCRQLMFPRHPHYAIIAGAAMAISLWVGGETVPWLATANLAFAALWVWHGNAVRRPLLFAATVALGALVLLLLARPAEQWWQPSCDSFSVTTVGLALIACAFWVLMAAAGRYLRSPLARMIAGGVAGSLLLGLWATVFPACLAGPYGEIDPRLVQDWLPTIAEAQDLASFAAGRPGTAIAMTLSPVLALVIAVTGLVRVKQSPRRRRLWFLFVTYLVVGLALSAWQVRVLPFANLFAIVPLAWAVGEVWRWSRQRWRDARRTLVTGAALLAVGPLGTAFGSLDRLAEGAASAPAEAGAHGEACDLAAVAPILEAASRARGRPSIIAAPVDLGAEILFRTSSMVLGAPYHRNGDGIIDTQRLFSASEPSVAEGILRERGVDFVLLCAGLAELRLYRQPAGGQSFSQMLLDGDVPGWLAQVETPERSGVLLLEYRPG